MATQGIAYATEQIKTEIASGMEKLKDFSDTLKENFETAQREIRRSVQRGRVAFEETADETRRTIKSHPLASWTDTRLADRLPPRVNRPASRRIRTGRIIAICPVLRYPGVPPGPSCMWSFLRSP
jgi:hypothetical protein